MKKCGVTGCKRPAKSLGFCGTHYQRFHKYGNPLAKSKQKGGIVSEQLEMSQDEVAQALGISSQRVGQIEQRAMEKLRAECQGRGMRELWLGPRFAKARAA